MKKYESGHPLNITKNRQKPFDIQAYETELKSFFRSTSIFVLCNLHYCLQV